ncbi:MAG TPA: RNase adapter RapZ [Ferruginibacter sp.]|nr:RNase adapter RapZ [Ferruginibacter sp.]HMP22281.1 RNase adapter RapZ [Ferruginibacter sp.]
MAPSIEQIQEIFSSFSGAQLTDIEKLPQTGSERHYYRLRTNSANYIATYGANIKENETFFYFSKHFTHKQFNTPQVLHINTTKDVYIQEDIGSTALLDVLEKEGYTEPVKNLYKQSLAALARMQVLGHEGLDYKKCLTNSAFGKEAIMADLLYFKYYFLDALRRPYDKQKLIKDFEALSNYLSHTEYKFFMFRDFQSRNILVNNTGKVFFIDYQGGMKGAPQYDVASLLWQAKANLPDDWKEELLEHYMQAFETMLGQPVDKTVFRSQYNGYVLIRLLQVLGAYGFRGLFERKAHFLTSIPVALQNLKWFVQHQSMGIALPEFKKVLEICTSDEVLQEFTPVQASTDTPLVVTINSFSFLQNGYPKDETDNGGGYVFDMRGILNPGRFDPYKHLSGQDKPVKDFLEQKTKMPDFLNGVYSLVDVSVEEYIKRGFKHLDINFGCTGGQHRSVYAAEALARHLRNKFKVKVELKHLNKENWKTVDG